MPIHDLSVVDLALMAAKTNAMRVLDQLGIGYETREYEVDPDDLTAETVAAKVGLPAEQVFKTLAVRGDRNDICLAVIPGNARNSILKHSPD